MPKRKATSKLKTNEKRSRKAVIATTFKIAAYFITYLGEKIVCSSKDGVKYSCRSTSYDSALATILKGVTEADCTVNETSALDIQVLPFLDTVFSTKNRKLATFGGVSLVSLFVTATKGALDLSCEIFAEGQTSFGRISAECVATAQSDALGGKGCVSLVPTLSRKDEGGRFSARLAVVLPQVDLYTNTEEETAPNDDFGDLTVELENWTKSAFHPIAKNTDGFDPRMLNRTSDVRPVYLCLGYDDEK